MAGLSVARDALQVFAGNASRDLGERICANLGVELGAADVRNFSDGEILVEIKDNVRGGDVFVVHLRKRQSGDHHRQHADHACDDAEKREQRDIVVVVAGIYREPNAKN